MKEKDNKIDVSRILTPSLNKKEESNTWLVKIISKQQNQKAGK